jgi:PAS domain S-box-containing protein
VWSLVYLLVAGSLACAHVLAGSAAALLVVYTLVALSGVGAIWLGIRWHRPEHPLPWHLFASGLLLFVAGDFIWTLDEVVDGTPPALVSIADAAYIAGYLPLIAAMFLLIRGGSAREGRVALVDALIIAVSVAVPAWVFAVGPATGESGQSPGALAVAAGYPLMDVLLLAFLARLLVAPAARSSAYALVIAGVIFLLGADTAYLLNLESYVSGSWLDVAWLLSYVCWGAAALAPAMRGLSDPDPEADSRLNRHRLALLGGAALTAPATLAVEAIRHDMAALPIALAAAALFVLVLLRARALVEEIDAARMAVKASERRFRTLVEQLPLITYIDAVDAVSSNVYSSPQTEEILGYTPDEWLAEPDLFPKVLHPDDRVRVLSDHAFSHATGAPLKTEYRLIAKDGRVVWVQDEAVVVPDDSGRPAHLQGFLLDITARKEADLVRNRLAAIVEMSDDAIFRATLDGVIQTWNRGAERMYGYTEEEIVGKSVARLIPPDRPREMGEVGARLRRGESVRLETVRVRKDGTPLDVSVTVSPIRDTEGNLVGAATVQRDVTEEKRAAEVRRQRSTSIELLQSIAVAANEATSLDEALQFALERVCAHTGWPVGHVYVSGEDGLLEPTQLWYLDDPVRFRRFRGLTERTPFEPGEGLPGRVAASAQAVWIVDVAEDGDFSRRDAAQVAGIRGAFAFPVIVGREVAAVLEFFSPRRADPDASLLELMTNVGAQLGRVVERTRAERALSEQNEQLRELDRMKDEFVALVSHELRTPLTSIRGYVDLLAGGRVGEIGDQQRRFLEIVGRNSARLLRLVDDLLFFSQARARGLELALEPLDVRDVARDAVEAARPSAEEKGIELSLSLDGRLPVQADRARLGQLLDNLLTNAIKFTAEGGRVDVSAARAESHAVVAVSDSGIGIPEEEQRDLFTGFFRSAAATERAIPGTGLGLAIARTIVEAHGGSIDVASAEGAGATFTVRLPVS